MTSRVRPLVALVFAALGCGCVAQASAQPPGVLQSARQLLVVITPDWDAVRGELRRFERSGPNQTWTPVGTMAVVVVGRNGMAWDPPATPATAGPRKAEGDGRSPAGVFTLGTAFGYAPREEASWLKLPYLQIEPGIECVDDVTSSRYNEIVDRRTIDKPDWTSAEKMREVGEPYRWGVVVNYNTPPVPKHGSCIFLHVASEDARPTSGCTAMSPPALHDVMAWLDPAAAPVLVQLPRTAYEATRERWGLP